MPFAPAAESTARPRARLASDANAIERPPAQTLAPTAPLEAIAAELYSTRAAFMLATHQGLTKTYNALASAIVSPGQGRKGYGQWLPRKL